MANIIGLTGQTGAGKSSVREIFFRNGAAVIDADAVSHDITENNTDCIYDIVSHFSCFVLNKNGSIDRKALGKRVFSDKKELLALNKIVFPYIRSEIEHRVLGYIAEGRENIVIDGATLIESGCAGICDVLVSVVADEKSRLGRIMRRDGISEKDAARRISSQHPAEFYTGNSQIVIENNGSTAELEQRVNAVLKNMLRKKENKTPED